MIEKESMGYPTLNIVNREIFSLHAVRKFLVKWKRTFSKLMLFKSISSKD